MKITARAVATTLALSWLAVCLAGCANPPHRESVVPALPPLTQAGPGAPNIVIIVADDLGYREVGSAGNAVIRTPNLDRLAAQGMRFDKAFVPTAMCSPSRAALYSGLYPHRNGLFRNHGQAKAGTRSMPHYFAALGYRVALAGKVHVGPPQSFPFELIDLDAESIERFLDADAAHPFVLVIAQHFPHVPWVANRIYDPETLQLPAKSVDTPQTRAAFGRYYASVTSGDEELGRIMRLMDAKGLSSSTITVFLSDHGAQFPFMKFSNYEAGLRVPLIFRWPGVIQPGASSGALVSSVDILPTLIDMAGGSAPAGLDGKSFLPVLRGASVAHRDAVFGAQSTAGLDVENADPYGIRSVRTERFRYIRNLHPGNKQKTLITEPRPLRGSIRYLMEFGAWVPPGVPAYWQSWQLAATRDEHARNIVRAYWDRPAEELYDLDADPDELSNLAGAPQHEKVLVQMRSRLDAWMRAQGDTGADAG